VTALYISRHDHYGLGTNKTPSAELHPDLLGPKVILYDMWRANGWDIITQGGFVTGIHHDASGFITCLYPRSGAKIWAYFYIKDEFLPKKRQDLFELYDDIFVDEVLPEPVGMGCLLIEEGDVL